MIKSWWWMERAKIVRFQKMESFSNSSMMVSDLVIKSGLEHKKEASSQIFCRLFILLAFHPGKKEEKAK